MTNPSIQFDDLPDEILMHILKSLDNTEVLFNLIDVNQKLRRILYDPIFNSHLFLLKYYPKDQSASPLPDLVLNRFCSTILPQIGHHVKTLCLEEKSMQRILDATKYPNLCELVLYDMDVNLAKSLLIDQNSLLNKSRKQISLFSINFDQRRSLHSKKDIYAFVFTQILISYTSLRCLKFNPSSIHLNELSFNGILPTVTSSTLVELHVRVAHITDCLYLLDGRFDQLRALYVTISGVSNLPLPTEYKIKLLPNLRIFSLYWNDLISSFDKLIVPLLNPMINLEELNLEIDVECNEGFIDGNILKRDITSHMPRLHKFTFNIQTVVDHDNRTNFPSNDDIQKTLENFYNNQVITCVDHFQEAGSSRCRIYSHPFKLYIYRHITNNFPGGLFTTVTQVTLYDERPFEYEFFLRIAESFPVMVTLTIENEKPQNAKQVIKSNSDIQPLIMIQYPNLSEIDLSECHDDYVELFLLDTKTSLPDDVELSVEYETLKRVTNGFIRNETRNNCEKVAQLYVHGADHIDERIKKYFRHTSIS